MSEQTWRILVGDVREKLRELPDQCVQTCVTSPPYWGLRDYGTASWDGGDPECDHRQEAPRFNGPKQTSAQVSGHASKAESHWRKACQKCGAVRVDSQIGLEPTPDAFVDALVSVFAEVWRVLKDDGTLWMNLGDSYLAQQGAGFNGQKRLDHANRNVKVQRPSGIKPKDLAGIPWTVALALRSAGWYLRSDIIWAKPNPMPESVTDRPTKAHEYLFLLSKSQRYYYNAEAIREPYAESTQKEFRDGYNGTATKDYAAAGAQDPSAVKARILRRARKDDGTSKAAAEESGLVDGVSWCGLGGLVGANRRTVWTITTQPYPEAHFATFPEALVEPCILAGSRVGDLVLDPFTGSGTTGAVAIRLGRSFVGCELNQAYVALAEKRIGSAAPLFAVESPGVSLAVDPQGSDAVADDRPRATPDLLDLV